MPYKPVNSCAVQGLVYIAHEMEEPRKGDSPANAVRMFTGSGSLIWTLAGCPSGLNGQLM